MKVTPKSIKNVKKFQEGGAMPVDQETPMEEAPMEEGAAEAPQGGQQDPMMMLAQASAQALQNQDCQIAMQVCQALLQLVQQMTGGSEEAQEGEPVFRKGGILTRRIKK